MNLSTLSIPHHVDALPLGFQFHPQFTDETATCMIVSENIFVMLLTHESLSMESREKVDEMVCNAIAAGGKTYNESQDHGFMSAHGFQDLDGHI